MGKYSFKSKGLKKDDSYMKQVIEEAIVAFNKFGEVGTDMQGYLFDELRMNNHGIKDRYALTDSIAPSGFPLQIFRKADLKKDVLKAKPVFTINKVEP